MGGLHWEFVVAAGTLPPPNRPMIASCWICMILFNSARITSWTLLLFALEVIWSPRIGAGNDSILGVIVGFSSARIVVLMGESDRMGEVDLDTPGIEAVETGCGWAAVAGDLDRLGEDLRKRPLTNSKPRLRDVVDLSSSWGWCVAARSTEPTSSSPTGRFNANGFGLLDFNSSRL